MLTTLSPAAQLGFEPRYAEPKSAVLPLDDRAFLLVYLILLLVLLRKTSYHDAFSHFVRNCSSRLRVRDDRAISADESTSIELIIAGIQPLIRACPNYRQLFVLPVPSLN